MEKIFTMKEAAEYLHYSMSTLRRRIDAGKIKTFKDGKLVRIKESELQKFIDGIPDSNQSDTAEPMPLKEESAQLPAEPAESRAAPLPDSWKK